MKKVMTALAVAATALLAFGDVQSGTSFEDLTTGEKAINALVGHTDTGSDSGDFYWLSGAEDQTETALGISNYVGTASTSTPIASRPAQFAGVSNSKYLHIDVSTPLSRTINPANAEGGPAAQAIGDGIYLDTLVQFTAADQVFDENALGTGDKIAIEYVATDDASNPITNFVIRAGYVDVANGQVTTKNYIMNPVDDFDVTEWHRLTVRTIANVGSSVGSVGFVVYLDGVALTYSVNEAAGDSAYVNALNPTVTTYLYNGETHALLPSAVAHGATGYNTLTAVAFQGNGSIDDISFTSTKPSFIQEATVVTVTWTPAEVTALTLNDKVLTAEELAAGSYDIEPVEGAVTFTATPASGYELGTCTVAEDKGGWNGSDAFTNLVAGAVCNIDAIYPRYEVNGNKYEDFDSAVAVTAAGTSANPATLKLLAACNQGLAFTEGYVVLDLNGFNIQGGSSEDYTIGNGGATLFITNSGVEASIKIPTNPQAGGVVMTAAGFTTFQAGKFEGGILTAADGETTFAKNFQLITGGKFFNDGESFYLADCVAEGYDATSAGNNYYIVEKLEGWAAVLGRAVGGAYEIDNLAELKAFQQGVADGLETDDVTFKLTANITLDAAWEGIGIKGGKDLANKDAGAEKNAQYDAGAFCGTFDGQNYTISNFQMENGTDYGAFFNSVYGATIKNLKIAFKEDKLCANSSASGGDTGASFVGVAKASTLQNLTTVAGTVTTVSASKDFGGIVGYLMAGSTVESCTNALNVASLKGGRKCGGIAIITQSGTGTAVIRNCKNSGTVTAAMNGGIVGYIGNAGSGTDIVDCENTAAVKLFHYNEGTVSVSGVNKGNATVVSNDKSTGVSGLYFATVSGDVATFVADNALALNGEYKVMSTNAVATFAFAEAGTISFDTALFTPTFEITAAEGFDLSDSTSGTVKTYTATAPAPAGWDDKPEDIPADTPAGTKYPALADTVLATADAGKLTTWAKAKNVEFSAVTADAASYVDAFLLNCATADVETAKEDFKLDITVNADGTVTVTAPEGYNVEPKIEGKASLSDKEWQPKTDSHKFFRAVLSL